MSCRRQRHLQGVGLGLLLYELWLIAAIRSDDCGGMRPQMQMGGVDLLVRAENAAEASEILDAAQDAVRLDPE